MSYSSTSKIGAWLFDAGRRRLTRDNSERRISPKAAAVLTELARAEGDVCSRQALLDSVWPTVTVGEEVLTHAISELRRALGDRRGDHRHIETISKTGYRLACPVLWAGETALALPGLTQELPSSISLDVYTRYLAARRAFERGGRHSALETIDLLRAASAADAGFSPAAAQLATALIYHADFYGGTRQNLEEAVAASRLALASDPYCVEALCASGLVMFSAGRIEKAKRAFAQALSIDRNSFDAHYHLGRLFLWSRDYEGAVALLDQAARLGGDDYHSHHLAACALSGLGRDQEATARYHRAQIALNLSSHLADNSVRGLVVAVACQMAFGMTSRAAELAEEIASRPDPAPRVLALTYARSGLTTEALDVLEAVADLGPTPFGWVGADPAFMTMRAEPRFLRLERTLAN